MLESDGLFRALFDRPVIERSMVVHVRDEIKREAPPPGPFGYRWLDTTPKPGPRGGVGNRAKTKAARKANLRRRRKP